ncbi:TetR/AcrR family transcriptional regulator [Leucobacter massiliensis]|uniref:HTH tetR-type domain-containing protein n=1 Tax=Leucobacter massiliensis TaxID=1686285 RepID=A0A2S9QQ65_9MICO|nr:TetR/AcrR family transcriptional regulator [Leucobacter massiliensis]PRI11712.1 hypothetical protein B4915_04510 [Leucobacter massiliensis]
MARIVKQAAERRDEILDAAGRLFVTRGYEATTIADLLEAVGIARGTLYHHFRSKEEVLDALIRRHGDRMLEGLRGVVASPLPPTQKFMAGIAAMSPQDPEQAALIDALGRSADTALFAKSLEDLMQRMAPVIAEVVHEGVATGEMRTAHPLEATRILLAATHALLDNPALAWSAEQRTAQFAALLDAAERLLGTEPGAFAAIAAVPGDHS